MRDIDDWQDEVLKVDDSFIASREVVMDIRSEALEHAALLLEDRSNAAVTTVSEMAAKIRSCKPR